MVPVRAAHTAGSLRSERHIFQGYVRSSETILPNIIAFLALRMFASNSELRLSIHPMAIAIRHPLPAFCRKVLEQPTCTRDPSRLYATTTQQPYLRLRFLAKQADDPPSRALGLGALLPFLTKR